MGWGGGLWEEGGRRGGGEVMGGWDVRGIESGKEGRSFSHTACTAGSVTAPGGGKI